MKRIECNFGAGRPQGRTSHGQRTECRRWGRVVQVCGAAWFVIGFLILHEIIESAFVLFFSGRLLRWLWCGQNEDVGWWKGDYHDLGEFAKAKYERYGQLLLLLLLLWVRQVKNGRLLEINWLLTWHEVIISGDRGQPWPEPPILSRSSATFEERPRSWTWHARWNAIQGCPTRCTIERRDFLVRTEGVVSNRFQNSRSLIPFQLLWNMKCSNPLKDFSRNPARQPLLITFGCLEACR